MVANGYVRGALEYAAGAWLPAASTSHLELVDRELRAAARVVTGCTMSTPAHALMAEAGLPTARTRRATLAARMLGTAASLPEGEPLRALADATPTRRLKTTTGWRDRGREALAQLDRHINFEERLHITVPPWCAPEGVTFSLEVGPEGRQDRPPTSGGGRQRTGWRSSRRRPPGSGQTARPLAGSWTEEEEPTSRSRAATPERSA